MNYNLQYNRTFLGEFEGLRAIRNTKTILAPKPIASGQLSNGNHFIAMEYLEMTPFSANSSSEFGSLLADMHMENLVSRKQQQFGFQTDTYCGFIHQHNSWIIRWVVY